MKSVLNFIKNFILAAVVIAVLAFFLPIFAMTIATILVVAYTIGLVRRAGRAVAALFTTEEEEVTIVFHAATA